MIVLALLIAAVLPELPPVPTATITPIHGDSPSCGRLVTACERDIYLAAVRFRHAHEIEQRARVNCEKLSAEYRRLAEDPIVYVEQQPRWMWPAIAASAIGGVVLGVIAGVIAR